MSRAVIPIDVLEEIVECQKDYLTSRFAVGFNFDYEEAIKVLNDLLFMAINKIEHENYCVGRCQSHGEKKVAKALIELGYTPYHNVIKKDCKGDFRSLPFDFGIIVDGKEMLIEYDGEQHSEPVAFFGGKSKHLETRRYDKIKSDYCLKHNIPLLRISKEDNIKRELTGFIKDMDIKEMINGQSGTVQNE